MITWYLLLLLSPINLSYPLQHLYCKNLPGIKGLNTHIVFSWRRLYENLYNFRDDELSLLLCIICTIISILIKNGAFVGYLSPSGAVEAEVDR